MRPEFHYIDLPGGAKAVLERVPRVPLVAMSVGFEVGSRHDPPGRSGMAHLFEHLRFAETDSLGRGEFMSAVDAWGGTANATTSPDMTRFYSVVPARHFSALVGLEAERFGHPVFRLTQESLETEKAVVLSERLQTVVNRPYGTAGQEAARFIYPPESGYHDQPIGTEAGVEATTLDDCLAFSNAYYVSGGLRIAVVGNLSPDEVTEQAGRIVSRLPQRDPPVRSPLPQAAGHGVARAWVPSQWPRRLYVGLPLPPAASFHFETARLGAFWLGRKAGSLLMQRMVRERQVATSVTLKTMARRDEASIGLIEILPAPNVSDAAVFGCLNDELRDAFSCGPTPEAHARAVAMYSSDRALEDDGVLSRAKNLTGSWLTKGSADEHFLAVERIHQSTPQQLSYQASLWACQDHRLELVYA